MVSRRDHLNISTMYSVRLKRILNIIIQVGSTEIGASEDLNALEKAAPQIMPLRILSLKGEVQIMPFQKLGGKCYFLLRFCMRN